MTTPIFNLNDIVLILTIVFSLALALFQPIIPGNTKVTKAMLAVFFISLCLSNTGVMLIWNEYIDLSPTVLAAIPYFYATALLIKGPALNLYVRSITENGFKLRPSHATCLLPIPVVLSVIAAFQIDTDDMRMSTFAMDRNLLIAVDFVWYAIKIVPLAYFIAATVRAFRYHQRLKQQQSDWDHVAMNWLYFLTIGFVVTGVWTIAVSILGYLYRLPLGITDNYFSFILLMALFYYSISHAQKLVPAHEETDTKPAEEKPLDTIIAKIYQGIESEKLYLNHALNIEQFAGHVGLGPREVSYAINKSFGTNFFEFINYYRVEEAKRLLASKAHQQLTIMDILLEAGFNSKSSFQRFFKRLTGMSPTEFRTLPDEHQQVLIAGDKNTPPL
ncbi:helix-turn-helix domain-containing protein [Marinimicrobium alkaliphilum]|uniref:helix-turn-helix domain-containing protein n=1 Tax=Marinimicrobium alkaliphilum TaxID=2202654 RepID=UPI000DBA9FB0|nr:AraC family transcriptional regulator [Marinimicrobium alkaliphilum]